MKTVLLTLTAVAAIAGVCYFSLNKTVQDAPDYDMYVFAIQWGKTMCIVNSGSTCTQKLANIPKNEMSIHGLWPSLKSGSSMSSCNSGTQVSIKDDGSDIFYDMKEYWPSLTGGDETFWNHEYNKHGYCYSNKIGDFDYKKYFQKSFDVFYKKGIPTMITDVFGQHSGEYSISLSEFKSKMAAKLGGNYMTPVCKYKNSKHYLQEIRFTMDLNFNYIEHSLGQTCSSSKPIYIPYQ